MKTALFAFNGDAMCFVHVLLTAMDMHEKGYAADVVIEGAATKLVDELRREDHPLHALYKKVKGLNLIAGACRACSKKMGVLEIAESEGLRLLDDMHGHPGMTRYREKGFEIVAF